MEKMDGLSMNTEQVELEKLAAVFPQCFVEGKLVLDKLLALLGEYDTKDFERYEFTWKGKSECLPLAQKRSTGTLRPCPEESVDFDTTQNLYIEGDNLEVLKLLQTPYYRQVKMIYIDPPYNTGNDFVYEDDFADTLARYKEITSQATKSNPESMGRFHTNWLNMMYPRLRLASNLLRDDGVIFISINDRELYNLKKVCDEVFGEENFVGTIIWSNATDNNPTQIAVEHEYLICYAKYKTQTDAVWKTKVSAVKDLLVEVGEKLTKECSDKQLLQEKYTEWYRTHKSQLWPLDRYRFIDFDGVYTGSQSVHNPGREGYRYDVYHPVTKKACKQPLLGYRFPPSTMDDLLAKDKILFGEDHNKIVELKVYAKDFEEKLSSIFELDGRIGTYDLKSFFGEKPIFSNPKPVQLIEKLCSFITTTDDIVLDFFSGSGTTAHAVMKLNLFDCKSRRFIGIQLPENLDLNLQTADSKAKEIIKNSISFLDSIEKPHFITEIGKERIRRVGQQIKSELCTTQKNEAQQLSLVESTQAPVKNSIDTGFKVFKLDSSNLKTWDSSPVADDNLLSYTNRFNDMIDRVKADRSDLDMVYEIMLKLGVPLTESVTQVSIGNKTAYSVGEDCLLLICLVTGLTVESIEEMAEYAPAKIILAENSLANDSAMSNAHYILRDRGIELKLV